jgi:hypothetical protein
MLSEKSSSCNEYCSPKSAFWFLRICLSSFTGRKVGQALDNVANSFNCRTVTLERGRKPVQLVVLNTRI